MTAPTPDEPLIGEGARTYRLVGVTLLAGLLVSIAVMVAGFIAAVISGGGAASRVLALDQILPGLGRGNLSAILDLGILLLFAAPVAGVAVALVRFVLEQDTLFVAVTAALLLVLVAAFALALR